MANAPLPPDASRQRRTGRTVESGTAGRAPAVDEQSPIAATLAPVGARLGSAGSVRSMV
ncbi:hypothetical protein ACWD6R_32370 [Streptomyces sp. NPDC005151]